MFENMIFLNEKFYFIEILRKRDFNLCKTWGQKSKLQNRYKIYNYINN